MLCTNFEGNVYVNFMLEIVRFYFRATHPSVVNAQTKLEKLMKELEEEERASITRLGDASIAAPFTSKYTSIASSEFLKRSTSTIV